MAMNWTAYFQRLDALLAQEQEVSESARFLSLQVEAANAGCSVVTLLIMGGLSE